MSLKLKENEDFTWKENKKTFYNVFGGYGDSYKIYYPFTKDNIELSNINMPEINSVVLYYNKNKKELIPVLILALSGDNWWEWKEVNDDFTLSEMKYGYGNFYCTIKEYKIDITYNISISCK
jgi:hypothetical protein